MKRMMIENLSPEERKESKVLSWIIKPAPA
jgi:hypothetical protein